MRWHAARRLALAVLVSAVLAGPALAAPPALKGANVHVLVAPELAADDKLARIIEHSGAVETLFAYLDKNVANLKLPLTTRVEITLTGLRLATPRSSLSAEVVVRDRDKVLARFDLAETTTHRGPKSRRAIFLVKGMSQRAFQKAKDVLRPDQKAAPAQDE